MSYEDDIFYLEPDDGSRKGFRKAAAEIAARADARIAELERECSQWRDELRIYRETENARIAELEQSVTVRDTEIARLETELEVARRDARRYRFVRMMNPREFDDMWMQTMCTCAQFDDLVDKARAGNGGE